MNKKIFISHRSSDKDIADIIESFLTESGVNYNNIFCSSLPGNDVKLFISEEIKQALKSSVINIILLSKDFYESPYCQNESGIIWFLDTIKIVIALPEINEKLMEGFLNLENKIRRLNNKNDVLAICDIISQKLPEMILSHQKLNSNVEKMISEYEKKIEDRPIGMPQTASNNNNLEKAILSGNLSDEEVMILLFFKETRKLKTEKNCIELQNWMLNRRLENIDYKIGFELLINLNYCENILDLSGNGEYKLNIATYRDLQKISLEVVTYIENILKKYLSNFKNAEKQNAIDILINKGFTDGEKLLIKYILDVGRENLYTGWQTENELNLIKNWEDINTLNSFLSSEYSNAILKLEMRKLLEPCAFTSKANTKEYKIKEDFLKNIKSLNQNSNEVILALIQKNTISSEDDICDVSLPF